MELGEKLRRARLEAGLTQKQLCGEEITRNMLSLLENGSASPSIRTLQYLSRQLGKSMSYFLEEEAVVSANLMVMEQARQCFDAGDWSGAARALEHYREPDPVYDREKGLMQSLLLLAMAEQAMDQERTVLARELLNRLEAEPAYCAAEISRRRALLLGRLGEKTAQELPSMDEELLLRAREALDDGQYQRAACLLDAVQEQSDAHWSLLRGRAYLSEKHWSEAARCFHAAEDRYPRETAAALEHCYRELEDYKRAYEYACKQR